MTDDELFALILQHLTYGVHEGEMYDARQSVILGEIARRNMRMVVARYVVRVDQTVPFAVGQCGDGADRRIVESAIDLKRGDEVIVSRDRPELDALGRRWR